MTCQATHSPAVFLDRDGVINADGGYVCRVEDFSFLPGTFEALREMARLGFKLVVVTNQSGIGRGFYTEADYQRVTAHMLAELAKEGVVIAGVYHCPHHPDASCECRKPKPGMIWRARDEHAIDLSRSWLAGDKPSDIEAARRAGIVNTVLIRGPGSTQSPPDPAAAKSLYCADSLLDMIPLL